MLLDVDAGDLEPDKGIEPAVRRTAPTPGERLEQGRCRSRRQPELCVGESLRGEHPGNLMWWDDRIYLLDFGMVGEVSAGMREQLMMLLMAFWQEDVSLLTDLTFSLAEQWSEAGEPAGIGGEVEFRTDVFDAASVDALIERLRRVLATVTAAPRLRLSSVNIWIKPNRFKPT